MATPRGISQFKLSVLTCAAVRRLFRRHFLRLYRHRDRAWYLAWDEDAQGVALDVGARVEAQVGERDAQGVAQAGALVLAQDAALVEALAFQGAALDEESVLAPDGAPAVELVFLDAVRDVGARDEAQVADDPAVALALAQDVDDPAVAQVLAQASAWALAQDADDPAVAQALAQALAWALDPLALA